jgi:hypothetical protein
MRLAQNVSPGILVLPASGIHQSFTRRGEYYTDGQSGESSATEVASTIDESTTHAAAVSTCLCQKLKDFS